VNQHTRSHQSSPPPSELSAFVAAQATRVPASAQTLLTDVVALTPEARFMIILQRIRFERLDVSKVSEAY
jgi:hypothetical protein